MSRFRPIRFGRELIHAIRADSVADLAAQLAYWSLFALFPFVMFLLTLLGYIPLRGLDRQLIDGVYAIMPHEAARLVDQILHEIVGRQRGWLLVVGLGGALWSASGGTNAAITALNRAYEVDETRPYWKVRLLALVVTIAGAAFAVLAGVGLAVGPNLAAKLFGWLGLGHAFQAAWSWLRWLLSICAFTLGLALVYWALPNVRQKFRLISPGAVTAVISWVAASFGLAFYASHFHNYARSYGALGGVILLLTWLYVSSYLVILGGEINAVLERHYKQIDRAPEPTARGREPLPA
jgi:membrane protein